jgi:hypothetical protein
VDRAAALLHDKNQAVALAGVTLMLAITSLDASAVERYRAHVPTLCKMLRQLLQVRLWLRQLQAKEPLRKLLCAGRQLVVLSFSVLPCPSSFTHRVGSTLSMMWVASRTPTCRSRSCSCCACWVSAAGAL